MGAITAAGSLARILGPVSVTYIYTELGTYWTFGIATATVAAALLVTGLTWNRLVPMAAVGSRQERNKTQESTVV